MDKIYKTHYDKKIDLPYRKIRYENVPRVFYAA